MKKKNKNLDAFGKLLWDFKQVEAHRDFLFHALDELLLKLDAKNNHTVLTKLGLNDAYAEDIVQVMKLGKNIKPRKK